MISWTNENLNSWPRVNITSISLSERLHVEKLGNTVKLQEAVQLSNAVSSMCLFPKGSSSHVIVLSNS